MSLWRRLRARGQGALRRGGAALLIVAASGGCQDQPDVLIPNRVLDRPTDVAFVCAHFRCTSSTDCVVTPTALSDCSEGAESGSCVAPRPGSGETSAEGVRLLGLVSNSERNEIAVFKASCGQLVDLDPDLPGYNFLPAGILPTDVDVGPSSCRGVAVNSGSCDLTLVDGAEVAAMAFGVPTEGEPSAVVGQLVPRRLDEASQSWVPIGARLGEVVSAPRSLSNAALTQGLDASACESTTPLSAYVTFPSCDLLAEIDLTTGNILQSRRFVEAEDGSVRVVDTGLSPVCAIDCPSAFPDGVPADLPFGSDERVGLSALQLVRDLPVPQLGVDPEEPEEEFGQFRLYTGGLGSDFLFEFTFTEDGLMACGPNGACDPEDPSCDCDEVGRVEVLEAKGVERIRNTPRLNLGSTGDGFDGGEEMFLYVIAGDGSTRVLRRDLADAESSFATECDTQVEATDGFASESVCAPVERTPEGQSPLGRRHFAQGPGIRAPLDVKITDWAFVRREVDSESDPDLLPYPCGVYDAAGAPIAAAVVIGIGTGSDGRLYWTAYPEVAGVRQAPIFDAAKALLPVELPLHSLSQFGDMRLSDVPRVIDADPNRAIADDSSLVAPLSPALRLIDYAYARFDEDTSANAGAKLGIGDADQLGIDAEDRPEDDPNTPEIELSYPYTSDAARILPRDYRSWLPGSWTMEWEGSLPSTGSATGVVRCAGCESGGDPTGCGWERASCKPQAEGDSRLVDNGAEFCDEGVLPGDKIHIFGCLDDGDCGIGQRCLTAAGTSTVEGICIPEADFLDTSERARLRQVCEEFIDDPCGIVDREYLITRAFQDELWLQALDRPLRAHVRLVEDPDAGVSTVEEVESQFICTATQPESDCDDDTQCQDLLEGGPEDVGGTQFACIEGRCQRPCEGDDECTLRRLPGPECFGEFIRYNVRARNTFSVRGPSGSDFFTDRVITDPDTGECRANEDANLSRLLTSRIPLGPDDANLGLPLCPDDSRVSSTDPNPCLITTPRAGPGDASAFHQVSYEGEPVSAVRFSNPTFSLVLDLVSLRDLALGIPDTNGIGWSLAQAAFKRSRIPRNYRIDFALDQGYVAHASIPFFSRNSLPLFFPVRTATAPSGSNLYIVDASGPGSASGLRGQVMRGSVCGSSDDGFAVDEEWDGVR